MKRRLFTLAAAASLLLCVATVALWVRSHTWLDSVTVAHCSVGTANGTIWLGLDRINRGYYWQVDPAYTSDPRQPRFHLHRGRDWYMYSIPHWLPAAAFAGASLLSAFLARRQRHAPYACGKCGYDLRASPERCPECGAAPAVK